MFDTPQIISPFEDKDFSTNLTSVELVVKITPLTKFIYINNEDITDFVTWVDGDTFDVLEDQVSLPHLVNSYYFKIELALEPNLINNIEVKVRDTSGNEKINKISITHTSNRLLNVETNPPRKITTDYKNKSVILRWEDNNDALYKPEGSGYKIYYTQEVDDRIFKYSLLNPVPFIDNVTSDVFQKEISRSSTTELVEKEVFSITTPGAYSKYIKISDEIYSNSYFSRRKVNLNYPYFSLDQLQSELESSSISKLESLNFNLTSMSYDLSKNIFDKEQMTSYIKDLNSMLEAGGLSELDRINMTEDATRILEKYEDLRGFYSYRDVSTSVIQDIYICSLIVLNIPSSNSLYSYGVVYSINNYNEFLNIKKNVEVDQSVNEVLDFTLEVDDPTKVSSLSSLNDKSLDTYATLNIPATESLIIVSEFSNPLEIVNFSLRGSLISGEIGSVNLYGNSVNDLSGSPVLLSSLSNLNNPTVFLDNALSNSSDFSYYILEITAGTLDLELNLSDFVLRASFTEDIIKMYYNDIEFIPIASITDQNKALYSFINVKSSYGIYEERFFISTEYITEVVQTEPDLTQTFSFVVNDDILPEGSTLKQGQPIFFKISYFYKDPYSNIIVESELSSETYATPFEISTQPVEISIPSISDIQSSLINDILENNPDLDLKPGSTQRTLFVNPVSSVLNNLYTREHFREASQSIVSLVEFDGVEFDGSSTPINKSSYKMTLRDALGLEDTTENNLLIQQLIDNRFDLMASMFGVSRSLPSVSSGRLNVYLSADLPENKDTIILPIGTEVSTTNPSVSFFVSGNVLARDFSEFRNETGEFLAVANITSIEQGSHTVVPAEKIVNINTAQLPFNLRVINKTSTYGGKDRQTNYELSESIRTKLLSLDTGTSAGYVRELTESGLVEKVAIIASKDKSGYMRRDYDFVLGRPGYNAVDVYVKAEDPHSNTDSIGIYYNTLTEYEFAFQYNSRKDQLWKGSSHVEFNLGNIDGKLQYEYFDIYKISRAFVPALNLELDLTNSFSKNRFSFFIDENQGDNYLLSQLVGFEKIYFDITFRHSFSHNFFKRPIVSINNVIDHQSNVYNPYLNYIPFNKTNTIFEGGSTIEDSGIEIIPSPSTVQYSSSINLADISSTQYIEVEDMWNVSRPIIYSLDNSKSYTSKLDFIIVRDSKYFYVRYPETSSIPEGESVRIIYGKNLSISKMISTERGYDKLVDELRYSYYPEFFIGSTQLVEGIHYEVFNSTGNNSYVTFDSDYLAFTETISYTYYKNMPLGLPTNTHYPISEGDKDFAISLFSGTEYEIKNKGVDISTIKIYPTTNTGILRQPYKLNYDYIVIKSDEYTTKIKKLDGGNILDSSLVDIHYNYGTPFTIDYIYNRRIENISSLLDSFAHAGSNFLVKSLRPFNINIKAIIYIFDSNIKELIDSKIRSYISSYINQLGVGDPLFESDIIRIIDDTVGVRNVKVELANMSPNEGTISYLEELPYTVFDIFSDENDIEVFRSPASVINDKGEEVRLLKYVPLSNGGEKFLERGVIVDGSPYTIVETFDQVGLEKGQAFISGSGSVFVSFFDGVKEDSKIEVTYQVKGSNYSTDIEILPFQYISLNRLDLSYIEV